MSAKIQGADIKTEADLIAGGATASSLPLDAQVYVTASGINKTLYQAIIDGDIGGGGGGGGGGAELIVLANTDQASPTYSNTVNVAYIASYDPLSAMSGGVFTAPADGPYVFVYNASSTARNVVLNLVKNYATTPVNIDRSDVQFTNEAGIGVGVVQLLTGDTVGVYNRDAVSEAPVTNNNYNKFYVIKITTAGGAVISPVASVSPTAASSVTISGLNGNTDKAWRIVINGAFYGVDGGFLSMRPNADTTAGNYRGVTYWYYSAAPLGLVWTGAAQADLYRHGFGITYPNNLSGQIFMVTTAGVPRTINATFGHAEPVNSDGGYAFTGGGWLDTSSNITSLVFDFDSANGGSFTGTINVYKAEY